MDYQDLFNIDYLIQPNRYRKQEPGCPTEVVGHTTYTKEVHTSSCNETIYVLSNVSLPNMYKVGFTTKEVQQRINQLNNTSIPTPFVLEYQYKCVDARRVEQLAHKALANTRIADNREFFSAKLDTIIEIIHACGDT